MTPGERTAWSKGLAFLLRYVHRWARNGRKVERGDMG